MSPHRFLSEGTPTEPIDETFHGLRDAALEALSKTANWNARKDKVKTIIAVKLTQAQTQNSVTEQAG